MHKRYLIQRYQLPQPRISLGKVLRFHAHAVMDISDGLVQDARHIAEASRVGITINSNNIPLSPAAKAALELEPDLLAAILSGGDDYELLFTVPKSERSAIEQLALSLRLPLTAIGSVKRGKGVVVLSENREPLELEMTGYDHFRG